MIMVFKFLKLSIPLGIHRSVEKNAETFPLHPVRDASLTGCNFCGCCFVFTERHIPNGM